MTVSPEMVIDVVDGADVPVGQIHRSDVFREHANFRVSHILIFNSRGDLLLQRLAKTRDRNPGTWGSSVASYLFSQESYREAAIRRASQELGVNDLEVAFVGKTIMIDNGCEKFIEIFRATYDGPMRIDRSHMDEVRFVPLPEIDETMRSQPETFTPTFRRVFAFYLSAFREV
jgi:isopentenyl-diphosphate delta-isomerase